MLSLYIMGQIGTDTNGQSNLSKFYWRKILWHYKNEIIKDKTYNTRLSKQKQELIQHINNKVSIRVTNTHIKPTRVKYKIMIK